MERMIKCGFAINIHTMGFPDSSAGKESAYNVGDPGSIPGPGTSLEKDRLPTPAFLGFPGDSDGKSACNAGDLGLIPGVGRSPMATYSRILSWRLPMDRGAWWAAAHGSQSQTQHGTRTQYYI